MYAQGLEKKQYEHLISICGDVNSFINNNNGEIKKINKKSFIYKTIENNSITNKYLINNDLVLAGVNYNNFTCIIYKMDNNKYISGWVNSNSLSSVNINKYDNKHLIGEWIAYDEYKNLNIDLNITDDKLYMSGASSFKVNNEKNLRNYISEGNLEYDNGIYKIIGEDFICEYKFYLYGKYLSVIDLGKCLPSSEFSLSGIYNGLD
ncbi:hypothetical protein [Bartonella sp. HY406]|uniref:hypothetical protein n=1 Tax=Bartonella sp. HY406 TaxID=2979331 RepID=UPI0021C69A30|nr:hypothetical protein [Bartonella sp. HY406]UXN03831.1 hypothetical protein N6B01_01960 [Bartonella sp. HY406]